MFLEKLFFIDGDWPSYRTYVFLDGGNASADSGLLGDDTLVGIDAVLERAVKHAEPFGGYVGCLVCCFVRQELLDGATFVHGGRDIFDEVGFDLDEPGLAGIMS